MKFVILAGNDIIGLCCHVTTNSSNDVDEYVRKYGFNDPDDAFETAVSLGIFDAKIIPVNVEGGV